MEISAHPPQERRKTPRTQLKEILYIDLEPDNGGIVVNISEQGLSFRSATPIQQALRPDEPIRLSFLLPQGQHLKVSAALVWTGHARKTGGLRFLNLSLATRAQILSLIGKSTFGAGPFPNSITVPPIQPLTADIHRLSPSPSQMPVETPPSPIGPFPTGDPSEYRYIKDSRLPPLEDPRSFRGVTFAFIVMALLVGAAWLVYSHRRDVGALMVDWGERLQGTSRIASQSPQTPAPQSPEQSDPPIQTAGATPQPEAAPAAPSENPTPPEQPSGGARAPVEARAPSSLDKRSASDKEDAAADLAAAQRYLQGNGRSRNSFAAAQLLWAAVAKGDSTAELTLADLYLKGDGVGRSCEQARVLLKAASDHGDLQAEQALEQVGRNRCR